MSKYGKSFEEIFNTIDTFKQEVQALPSKLHSAENFKSAMNIEYLRMQKLYEVLHDIYGLNDLNNCFGITLDYTGADVGAPRESRDDESFREYIRMIQAINLHNGGTIPDIKKVMEILFGDSASDVDVEDLRDGRVRIVLPTTLSSTVFTLTASEVAAAGIELIVELLSAFKLGINFSAGHETIKDRDAHIFKAQLGKKVTSGQYFKRYGSRVSVGMGGI